MRLVFLLEERSMKVVLDRLLPQILPEGIDFITIPHEGKSDLRKSIPIKLKAWNEPNVKFVIVHDQDAGDCTKIKKEIVELCCNCGRDYLVRIACHELEAWYWGDIDAIEQAYGIRLDKIKNRRKYSDPDAMVNPKLELLKIIPNHQQISGAMKISRYMNISGNRSKSFQVFVSGVKEMCRV